MSIDSASRLMQQMRDICRVQFRFGFLNGVHLCCVIWNVWAIWTTPYMSPPWLLSLLAVIAIMLVQALYRRHVARESARRVDASEKLLANAISRAEKTYATLGPDRTLRH